MKCKIIKFSDVADSRNLGLNPLDYFKIPTTKTSKRLFNRFEKLVHEEEEAGLLDPFEVGDEIDNANEIGFTELELEIFELTQKREIEKLNQHE